MQFELSKKWIPNDKSIYFVHNFTDVREGVDVETGGEKIENTTLTKKQKPQWASGDNVIYNDTETREMHFVVNGKNQSRRNIKVTGHRCVYSCVKDINETEVEGEYRRWSDVNSWPNKTLPVEGQDVEIESGWNMLYDIEESPKFNMIEINGRLTFEDAGNDLHLKAKYIFVRAGELIIGTPEIPYLGNAKITLYGEKANQHITYTNAIEAGNKIIANTNKISMHGVNRSKFARLRQEAYPNESTIFVDKDLDWVAGDKIGIAPTGMKYNESEYAIISSYDRATGELVLDRALAAYHYGASNSTASIYGGIVDIRAEVFLLSRNIKIAGADEEAWGCQILTSDFLEFSGRMRTGSTIMDNVEIYNCS